MKAAGFSFAVVRAWRSFGSFDPVAPGSIAALWDAGFAHVDGYAFPCAGQSAAAQMNALVADLSKNGVKYGMLWLDIETNPSPACGWAMAGGNASADGAEVLSAEAAATKNCDYMGSLISALKANGVNVGTYASSYMWSSIMGDACTIAASTPLWYPHYDADPSFSDFKPFGGWATPAIKQFNDGPAVCGVGADHNFY